MSMSGHRRNTGPCLGFWIKTFDSVEGLKPIPPANYVQGRVQYRHTELESSTVHVSHLLPLVSPHVVHFYADRSCENKINCKKIDSFVICSIYVKISAIFSTII